MGTLGNEVRVVGDGAGRYRHMKDRLETALQVALVLLVVALVAGQAIGQPVLVSYAETGSMEPTIDAGDGFLVVPAVLASSVETGDVIVFQAETLNDGSVTTHRVVGESSRGYVTQGDANTFPDQDGDEPPVSEDRVLGKAVTVSGEPVVVPRLGHAIQTVEGVSGSVLGVAPSGAEPGSGESDAAILFLGVGLALVGAGLLLGVGASRRRDTERGTARLESYDARRVLVAVVAVVVVAATAGMVMGSGTTEYGLVAQEGVSDDPFVVEPGTTGTVTHDVRNGALAPVVVVRESTSDDVRVTPRSAVIGPRSAAETTLRVDAPDGERAFDRTISERRYVAVLPPSLLVTLHSVHPWLAIVAVDTVIALGAFLAGVVMSPGRYVRVRTDAGRSPWRRIERLWKRQD